VPLALTQFVKRNHVLHQRVLLVTVVIEEAPRIADEDGAEVIEIIEGITRVILHFGFMQYPTIAEGLSLASSQGKLPGIDLSDVTYYIGSETIIPSEDVPGMWGLAGNAVCLLAAQCRALSRFFRRAGRTGRRIRHRDRNLGALLWGHLPRTRFAIFKEPRVVLV
jgi:KUP system potassium uptake protein